MLTVLFGRKRDKVAKLFTPALRVVNLRVGQEPPVHTAASRCLTAPKALVRPERDPSFVGELLVRTTINGVGDFGRFETFVPSAHRLVRSVILVASKCQYGEQTRPKKKTQDRLIFSYHFYITN